MQDLQDTKIGKNQAFWKLLEKEMSHLVLIMFTNVHLYSLNGYSRFYYSTSVSVISSHRNHVFNFAFVLCTLYLANAQISWSRKSRKSCETL